jgi:hypothetical protein
MSKLIVTAVTGNAYWKTIRKTIIFSATAAREIFKILM